VENVGGHRRSVKGARAAAQVKMPMSQLPPRQLTAE